MFVYLAHHMPS